MQENNFEAWRGRARERNKRQTERDSMTKDRVLRGTHTHTQPPTFPVLHGGFIVRVHVAAVTQTNKNTSKRLRNLFARVRAHKRWLNDCGRDGDDGRVEPNAFLCAIKTALGLDCRAVMGDGALLNIQSGKAMPYHQIRMCCRKEE